MIVLPDFSNILLFALSSLILVMLPGPAFIYIITRTTQQGIKAGVYSMLGIEIGTLFHVFAIAYGLSIIILKSDAAFIIIKFGGIVYLTFLGIKSISKAIQSRLSISAETENKKRGAFLDGIILGALNIKTLLFLLAFIPQFVNNEKGGQNSQIIFLGLCFVVIAVSWGTIMIFFISKLKKSFSKHIIPLNLQNCIAGTIYILLAVVSLSF